MRMFAIEKLNEEVQEHIRLGRLSASVGRELAKVPCGEQKEVAAAVMKHRFSKRETAKLIAYMLSSPRWEHRLILASPWQVVEPREPKPVLAKKLVLSARVCEIVPKE